VGVLFFGWFEPVAAVGVVDDLPVPVVGEHVVVAAEEDAVGDVGGAVVFGPVVDVVGFFLAEANGWDTESSDERRERPFIYRTPW